MFDTLNSLLEALRKAPAQRDAYHEILSGITFGKEELAPYIHFRTPYYTRNLIEKNPNFEIMTLCWQPGHYTPIHDHQGSEGWLHVIEGRVLEKIYHYNPSAEQDHILKVQGEVTSEVGGLSHINDALGYHSIHNVGESQAITLHFYSPAIKKCLYVCPDNFETRIKQLSYFSENGTIVAE